MRSVQTLLCMVLVMFFIQTVTAQEGIDVVYMLNGDINKGKVTAINNETVGFVYSGETLAYTFKKSEINKIEFASGRTQVINEQPSKTTTLEAQLGAKGKLAVMPFTVVSNDESLNTTSMGEELQHYTIESIQKNTSGVTVLDPVTTNALLLKNGITKENIKSFMPAEIAKLIGVEFVVYGSGTINFKGTYSTGTNTTSYKDKEKSSDKDKKTSGRETNTNYNTTKTQYDTNVELIVYNDQGQDLYSVKRNAFGTSLDTYQGTVNYLVKRSPWGSKHK